MQWLFSGIDDAKYDGDVVDSSCLKEKGYELSRQDETLQFGEDYDVRIREY